MTFKQILTYVTNIISNKEYHPHFNKQKLVTTKRGLSQLRTQLTRYKKSIEKLIAQDNFDMSEYDNYLEICRLIETLFENAVII